MLNSQSTVERPSRSARSGPGLLDAQAPRPRPRRGRRRCRRPRAAMRVAALAAACSAHWMTSDSLPITMQEKVLMLLSGWAARPVRRRTVAVRRSPPARRRVARLQARKACTTRSRRKCGGSPGGSRCSSHPGAPDQAAGHERDRRRGGVGDAVVLDEVAQARVEPVARGARPGLHAGADRADVRDLALAHVDGRPAGGRGRGGRGRSRRSRGRSARRRGRWRRAWSGASSRWRRRASRRRARASGIGSGHDVAREQPRDRAEPRRALELAPERREAEGRGVRLAVGAVDVAAGEADVGVSPRGSRRARGSRRRPGRRRSSGCRRSPGRPPSLSPARMPTLLPAP